MNQKLWGWGQPSQEIPMYAKIWESLLNIIPVYFSSLQLMSFCVISSSFAVMNITATESLTQGSHSTCAWDLGAGLLLRPFSPFLIHAKMFSEGISISLGLSRKQKTHSIQVNEESLITEMIYNSVLRKSRVFIKLKNQWSTDVLGIGCSEHVIHSCTQIICDILSINNEKYFHTCHLRN